MSSYVILFGLNKQITVNIVILLRVMIINTHKCIKINNVVNIWNIEFIDSNVNIMNVIYENDLDFYDGI